MNGFLSEWLQKDQTAQVCVSRCAPRSASLCLQTAMSQVEKKVGLLRRSSSSKKPLKEKVVLMYDEIFAVRGFCSFSVL